MIVLAEVHRARVYRYCAGVNKSNALRYCVPATSQMVPEALTALRVKITECYAYRQAHWPRTLVRLVENAQIMPVPP